MQRPIGSHKPEVLSALEVHLLWGLSLIAAADVHHAELWGPPYLLQHAVEIG